MRFFATIQVGLLELSLLAGLAVPANPALAADMTIAPPPAPLPLVASAPMDRYSFEINPLPMLLLLSPGSGGIAGSFEARMSRHLSVFADVYHTQVRQSDQSLAQMQKDQDQPDGIPADMATSGLATGCRYYGDAFTSSWYVGGKVGGGTTDTDWAYGDQRYEDDSFDFTLGAEAGYRWLWDSGFLLRLGGGGGMTDVTQRSVSALSAVDGTAGEANIAGKAPAHHPTVAISYDVGLGWTF